MLPKPPSRPSPSAQKKTLLSLSLEFCCKVESASGTSRHSKLVVLLLVSSSLSLAWRPQ